MKIAYILTWNLQLNDGVTRKIARQAQAWRDLGHEVEVFCASYLKDEVSFPVNIFHRRQIWSNPLAFISNRRIYMSLCDAVRNFAPDLVYLRWEFHKRPLAKLMSEVPTVIELNTHYAGEIRRRAKGSWIERVRLWYYKFTHHHFEAACAGFVAVSKEILDKGGYRKMGKPAIHIPNSIPLGDSGDPVPYKPAESGLPRLVFISSGIQPWHGFSELLKLADVTRGELEFDLITGFKLAPSILPTNVRNHEFLEKDEFLRVFEGAICGIGSAGLFENDMEEASVLKVREYLAAGLPVIIPYKDTAFLDSELPEWVLELPNRRDGLLDSREDILSFLQKMEGRRIPLAEVAPFVGSDYWEAQRVNFLVEVAGGHGSN
jgi:hypothetical protein